MYEIPTISIKQEIETGLQIIAEIKDYKAKNWAIGETYPDGGPDGFAKYFVLRGLTIHTYLRGNISVGEPSAYDADISQVEDYLNFIRANEINLCKSVITSIENYKKNNWAIGDAYPNGGPDAFCKFFAARELPIESYLRGNISVGQSTAYDNNIKTLNAYISTISKMF